MEKNTSQKIEERLQELNISQKDLANKVNVTEATISRYISGDRNPRGEILFRIAKALGLSTDYLLGNSSIEQSSDSKALEKYKELSKICAKKGLTLEDMNTEEFGRILDIYMLAKGINKD